MENKKYYTMKNIAIIGTSSAAITHIKSYDEMNDVNIKWIFSEDINRAEYFTKEFNIVNFTSNYNQILEDKEIDYIDICNIPEKHIAYAEKAIDSGKGLIIEKPISHKFPYAKNFFNKYKDSQYPIMIVYQYPYSETFKKLKEIIDSKKFGSLKSYFVRYHSKRDKKYYDKKWRTQKEYAGGGVLISQGIHFINLIFSYTGYTNMRLCAKTLNIVHKLNVEDTCLISILHDNGILGNFDFSTGLESNLEICLYLQRACVTTKGGKVLIKTDVKRIIDTPTKGTFQMLVQNYFNKTEKIHNYKMNFYEALLDLGIIEQIYKSASRGESIDFYINNLL